MLKPTEAYYRRKFVRNNQTTEVKQNGSPVSSLGWSILYLGVEYKSRRTGPLSAVTKSKDVPFEVGTACKSRIEITNNISLTEEQIRYVIALVYNILPHKGEQE